MLICSCIKRSINCNSDGIPQGVFFNYIEIYIRGTCRSSRRVTHHIARMAYATMSTSNSSISLSYSLPLYIDFTNPSKNFLFFFLKIESFLLRQIFEALFGITEIRIFHDRSRLFLYKYMLISQILPFNFLCIR